MLKIFKIWALAVLLIPIIAHGQKEIFKNEMPVSKFFTFKSLTVRTGKLTYATLRSRTFAQPILLRGVNYAAAWNIDVNNIATARNHIKEIAKTGANAIRLVWQGNVEYGRTPAILDSVLTWCSNSNIIAVPELHNAADGFSLTCGDLNAETVDKAVQYWTRPDVLAILKKHQRLLILNIGNEIGKWDGPDGPVLAQKYAAAYLPALVKLRSAALVCPIMMDAPYCGQNGEALGLAAQLITAQDQNTIFSVHAYWQLDNYAQRLATVKANMRSACWVIGEFSRAQDCPADAPANDYKTIMNFCNANAVGYFAWVWGGGNLHANSGAQCQNDERGAGYNRLSMTDLSGNFSKLKGWGLEVANDIATTSKKITP